MKHLTAIGISFLSAALLAGPAEKPDPVSEFYPDWQGVTQKGYISGREIGPSDLRHKVTIVVEVEANEKLMDQLVLAGPLVAYSSLNGASTALMDWDTLDLPRDVIAVVSVHGAKKHSTVTDALSGKGLKEADGAALSNVRRLGTSVYEDVTFTGAPDNGGKYPFVYVMGPGAGKEPLYKGELTEASAKEAVAAVNKAKRQIAGWEQKWQPFYGNVGVPKYNTSLAKALEKGRTAKKCPLDAVQKGLLADIKSADEERSKEAQVLFDAINQTRSDLLIRLRFEVAESPHCAYYDLQTLFKYWPNTPKKALDAVTTRLKAYPMAESFGKTYVKLKLWSDPSFTCKNAAEAKKIVAELNKMKKQLAAHKESQNINIQNGALLLDSKIDTVIELVQSKVAGK